MCPVIVASEYSRRSPSSGLSSFAVNRRAPCTIPRSHFAEGGGLSVIDHRENSRSVDLPRPIPLNPRNLKLQKCSFGVVPPLPSPRSGVSRTEKVKSYPDGYNGDRRQAIKPSINPANRSFTRVERNWIGEESFSALCFFSSNQLDPRI